MPTSAPVLVVIAGTDAGRRIVIKGKRLVIGRAPVCDFILGDAATSREHAAIERAGDTVTLVDLGSVNGTFVEGVSTRVIRHELRDGDEIMLGRTRMRIELPGGPARVVARDRRDAGDSRAATGGARDQGARDANAPVLTIVAGAGAGRTVTLAGERLVIGRAPACDLVLDDAKASRRHAAIEPVGDALTLVDLGSANGTFVEGVAMRIGRHELRDGDEFVIGSTRLRITLPARAIAAAPATMHVHRHAEIPIVLTVVAGPDRGMVYSPTTDVITLGRLTSAEVPLSDPAASRLHATIKREGSGYVLYDEQSRNGTAVGSPPRAVTSAPLENGDTIRIGETEIRVDIGAGPGAEAEAPKDVTMLAGMVGDRTFTMSVRGLGARAAGACGSRRHRRARAALRGRAAAHRAASGGRPRQGRRVRAARRHGALQRRPRRAGKLPSLRRRRVIGALHHRRGRGRVHPERRVEPQRYVRRNERGSRHQRAPRGWRTDSRRRERAQRRDRDPRGRRPDDGDAGAGRARGGAGGCATRAARRTGTIRPGFRARAIHRGQHRRAQDRTAAQTRRSRSRAGA